MRVRRSMKLKGKNAVITGGSTGLGRAIAIKLAKEGANVVITYNKHPVEANAVIQEIRAMGRRAMAIKVDMENEADRDRLVEESHDFLKQVDILVNNAGIIDRDSFLAVSPQQVRKIFAVNVLAPFFITQAFARKMVWNQKLLLETGELNDFNIISISSISATIPTGFAAYEASKAAITQMTKSASHELSRYYIRVNTISPGLVPTELNRNRWDSSSWQKSVAAIPLGRPGRAEEIAEEVFHVLTSSWKTATDSVVDGGRMNNWLGSREESETTFLRAKL